MKPFLKLATFFIPFFVFSQTSRNVYWQTWNQIDPNWAGDTDPAGSTLTLKGTNAAGSSLSDLYNGSDGVSNNGDLIELGYFDTGSAANTGTSSSGGLFKGEWVALTDTTTLGHKYNSGWESTAGEFYFQTLFSNNNGGSGNDLLAKVNPTQGGSYEFDDDTANLVQSIDRLDAAGSNARLGIRFYDNPSKSGSRYNTILSDSWTWSATQNFGGGSDVFISLHNSDGTTDNNVKFEFDNSNYNSVSDIGTGGTNAVGTDDYAATITYYDGASNLNLTNSTLNSVTATGDAVLSGLHKETGGGTIYLGNDNILTVNSTLGNAYDFSGDIHNGAGTPGAASGTLIKTGEGEQILTGDVLLAGSNSGWADIYEGTLTFRPDDSKTQTIEYLTHSKGTGSPILTLDNDNHSTQTLTFGLTDSSHESSDRDFSGNVYLSDTGTNTLHVASNTASGDYDKTQILSGVISGSSGGTAQAGSAKLKKTGVGRLQLSGSSANTFDGGVDIDDGVLVVGKNTGAGTGTITIKKGKLEISSSVTVSNTIQGGTSNSKKSIIGGKGTVSSNIVIGDGSGEIDVISPGQGLSSSLTETSGLSNNQAPLGNVHAGGVGDSIGTFSTTGNLTLAGGGVFDWEIKDFHGGSAGTDWDVLAFNNLTFDAHGGGTKFVINILGLDSNGNAGAPADYGNTSDKTQTNGFLFLNGSSAPTWNGWDGNNDDGSNDINNYFDIRVDDYAFRTNHWHGDWSVYYDSANHDFYLQYSAVPEPSTYIMVTGLLMLPGYSWLRRFRKKLNSTAADSQEI